MNKGRGCIGEMWGMWLLKIWRLHEGLGGCLEEAGLLNDLTKILDHMSEALIIIKGYGGGLHPVLLRTFVLENLERIEDYASAYAQYVGATTMRALCDELKEVFEGGGVG